MRVRSVDLDAAIYRSHETWNNKTSHVEAEQAFIDRRWLAAEVAHLRGEVVQLREELEAALEALDRGERTPE